jgi:hypothetical protein
VAKETDQWTVTIIDPVARDKRSLFLEAYEHYTGKSAAWDTVTGNLLVTGSYLTAYKLVVVHPVPGATPTILGDATLSGVPAAGENGIAFSASQGKAYVGLTGVAKIDLVLTTSPFTVAPITTPHSTNQVVVDEDGLAAWSTCYAFAALEKIAFGGSVTEIALGRVYAGLALDLTAQKLWLVATDVSFVSELVLGTGAVTELATPEHVILRPLVDPLRGEIWFLSRVALAAFVVNESSHAIETVDLDVSTGGNIIAGDIDPVAGRMLAGPIDATTGYADAMTASKVVYLGVLATGYAVACLCIDWVRHQAYIMGVSGYLTVLLP